MPRKSVKKVSRKAAAIQAGSYLGKIEGEIKSNQSKVSMILGALILLVIGILISTYFSKPKPALGPAQQTDQQVTQQADVTPDSLPGKYTVKEGDTLFDIADKYYQDGYKFTEIAKVNNIVDVNNITTGQVLNIPKLPGELTLTSPSPTESAPASPEATSAPEVSPSPEVSLSPSPNTQTDLGTGGGNTTIWGPKIEGNTYTVVEGDWLSTISARAYGDIFAYKKIVDANNIANPDLIEPGQVLTIPR